MANVAKLYFFTHFFCAFFAFIYLCIVFKNVMLVALGGAVGSVARYLLSHVVQESASPAFPFGTLVVNVLGCFVIGVITSLAATSGLISGDVKLILATGFCGGFTTFSTFMNETVSLSCENGLLPAVLYVDLSVVLGIMAVMAGMLIVKLI